jgi:lipopolysaccharide transport system ATP-binding protein
MPDRDVAVSVRGLSKCYQLTPHAAKNTTMAEAFLNAFRKPFATLERETFWALRDVDFDVHKGDVVGIIGRNGAGKSTLLKILSRITEPTSGQIDLYGRVGSLLEVGTGFHPELTGRENIFMNGAILGMSRREIARHFDAIVEFAEVEKFLDTPVKRYSSGMYVRLAFAVAAHLNPEILIVDEVLAVGDAEFQRKCLGKMQDVARNEGRTVLFVSHNMGAIKSLCTRAVLLNKGQMVTCADTDAVIRDYISSGVANSGFWKRDAAVPQTSGVVFDEIRITDPHGATTSSLDSDQPITLVVRVRAASDLKNVQINLRVTNQEGIPVFTTANSDTTKAFPFLTAGLHTYVVTIPSDLLPPGTYSLLAGAITPNVKLYDVVDNDLVFNIEDVGSHATLLDDRRQGVVSPMLAWQEHTASGEAWPEMQNRAVTVGGR